ncbi:methylated-DNA--[protein]-cysteine S-methyltransferase [Uliginosibacterium sp. 31-12]|uniref:methylated-DNA--[protein]-cysteine S-methyltransferase n=1 Tax=Uliginosibacterium sp. 31-12 TaxID=3062781 RepID=UPI0026E32A77|nr:methylated-DNA--[protein]-cysteine S-methyltransferase [Uliginosibacterium sp. 31-12]MDO6387253.1 methylated-DNA--[protein]-cysteine S-methyltransferase [Uliginosibacterium sp. 31-12]
MPSDLPIHSAATQSEAYATIAQAIRFLREHAREQPDLAVLADALGLSSFHLQRLFSAWAGVSPKRFLQFLSKEEARRRLRASASVLEASLASGLSGPGRLHDLMVTCEAVTPGEVAQGGAGLDILYGSGLTPLGQAFVALTPRGICRLEFLAEAAALAVLREEWPRARLCHEPDAAQRTLNAAFQRLPGSAPLHLLLRGSNFQIQVWQALLRIPPGDLASYGQIARALGKPQAARAVGSAIGANTIAALIPCHRVIRESGDFSDYRWGIERKQALIALEAAQNWL